MIRLRWYCNSVTFESRTCVRSWVGDSYYSVRDFRGLFEPLRCRPPAIVGRAFTARRMHAADRRHRTYTTGIICVIPAHAVKRLLCIPRWLAYKYYETRVLYLRAWAWAIVSLSLSLAKWAFMRFYIMTWPLVHTILFMDDDYILITRRADIHSATIKQTFSSGLNGFFLSW